MDKNRPKHLVLHQIKLPLPGIVSILHRISGALLFLALPLLLWMLQASLHSIETHTQLAGALQHPLSKLLLLALSWALAHHFCAGLRHLAIDLHWLGSLRQARLSSKIVLAVSLSMTLGAGVWLW